MRDAPPACFSGINWAARQFFPGDPGGFIRHFLSPGRDSAHINEIERSVEMVCTVLRGADDANSALFGITANSRANMRFTKCHAESGDGLRLTRAPSRWVWKRSLRFLFFYCTSQHNASADFVARATDAEITACFNANQLTRINAFPDWM